MSGLQELSRKTMCVGPSFGTLPNDGFFLRFARDQSKSRDEVGMMRSGSKCGRVALLERIGQLAKSFDRRKDYFGIGEGRFNNCAHAKRPSKNEASD